MNDTAQATKEDLKRNKKRCWCPDCKGTAFFQDWCGWNWCLKHAWREIILSENTKWFTFTRMRIRNPY